VRQAGLTGLGGAEFHLPLIIGAFQFGALEAVVLNKAMSLVVVASALPLRAHAVPWFNLGYRAGGAASAMRALASGLPST